ncbi:MAG: chromosome segregation protein SMC [Kiritimatiellae bacterium]|nr:chromosome segregation protein SMC [Kiritimatiellia bacterium]
MYLKALEIQGFKSFADRTRLTFEPGMIAIVGPNGCGKSNVSDAIRWVLGEQRPSALRCSKMQDLIFNGTDARKPLGMVEVSLHFADCEQALGTEYAEVSIARRAYRSGENTYFLNKTPCRLKDIQRLFMGTGVGTTSYSVMAQGQIDAILSSRPEDRRAVFEEAAGITKFKADRKEALRKIAQTEENLTRVTDILRELKRQGTLLQRQAEKAERAKILRTELRGLDLYLSKKRLAVLENLIAEAGIAVAEAANRILAIQDEAETGARAIAEVNAKIQAGEDAIARLSEQSAASIARHSRAQEIIETNLTRITEYRNWAVGLEKEIHEAQERIAVAHQDTAATPDLSIYDDELEILQNLLEEAQAAYDERKEAVDATRAELQQARNGLAQCDRQQLHWQQVLSRNDSQREERLIKRERLAAETAEAMRQRDAAVEARVAAEDEAETHRSAAEEARESLIILDEDRSFLADDAALARQRQEVRYRQIAALEAQRELLSQPVSGEHPDAGLRLLDPANPFRLQPGDVIGALSDQISVDQTYCTAVEAVLEPWSKAILVRSATVSRVIFQQISQAFPKESLQLLVLETDETEISETPSTGVPLADVVTATPEVHAVIRRLLKGIVWLPELPETLAEDVQMAVLPDGKMIYRSGDAKCPILAVANAPLARKLLCAEVDDKIAVLKQEIEVEEGQLAELQTRIDAIGTKWRDTQRQLERSQRLADQAAGVYAAADRDAKTIQSRLTELEVRLSEITALAEHEDAELCQAREGLLTLSEEREQYTQLTSRASEHLTLLEGELDVASTRLTEARFRMAGFMQKREHAVAQARNYAQRLKELEATIASRNESIRACFGNIEKLEADNLAIMASLDGMQQETLSLQQQIETARADRLEWNARREQLEAESASARKILLEAQEAKTRAEVAMAENRTRHQALMERLVSEYGIVADTLAQEPCASWETDETPDESWIETRMSDIRVELDKIGPVNLLAIEEFQALEERHTFYQTQADDLERSRNELLSLIKTINDTSGKMFRETFERANANFEKMFTRLFHGGEARLVLMENAEDPLECGIDIIARPPGKKPQTISLLSGGERTMTAVSLLFAIFLIKPAPFCLLDELDAALDDSNIGRFVDALKDFLVHSQFLIITHNQHTIAGSDIVYGVTMPEKGVSKTLSMRFSRTTAAS